MAACLLAACCALGGKREGPEGRRGRPMTAPGQGREVVPGTGGLRPSGLTEDSAAGYEPGAGSSKAKSSAIASTVGLAGLASGSANAWPAHVAHVPCRAQDPPSSKAPRRPLPAAHDWPEQTCSRHPRGKRRTPVPPDQPSVAQALALDSRRASRAVAGDIGASQLCAPHAYARGSRRSAAPCGQGCPRIMRAQQPR